MAVKIKTTKNKIPSIEKNIKGLNGRGVQVGVLSGEHKWLASIHEYGCVIKPSKKKYLTIPANSKAYGKKASDFKDLIFIESKDGDKFLARKKGKDSLEVMFWLTTSVTIPERSFLRGGYDENIDAIVKTSGSLLADVLSGTMSEDAFLEFVGSLLRDRIKDYARDLNSPPNHPLTIKAKGGSNPLVDTGDMIGGIDWREK